MSTPTESAECLRCEQTIHQGDIIITSKKTGLGKPKRQHIEAHCRHCKVAMVFEREFTGNHWQRVGGIAVVNESDLSAKQQRQRADLEHAIHYDPDHEFSGDEEGNYDSNGQA